MSERIVISGPDRETVRFRPVDTNPVVYEPFLGKSMARGAVIRKTRLGVVATVHFTEYPNVVSPQKLGLHHVSATYEGVQPAEEGLSGQPEHKVRVEGAKEAADRYLRSLAVIKKGTVTVEAEGATALSLRPDQGDNSPTILRVYSSFVNIAPQPLCEEDAAKVELTVNNDFISGETHQRELQAVYRGSRADVLRVAAMSFIIPAIKELSPPKLVEGMTEQESLPKPAASSIAVA